MPARRPSSWTRLVHLTEDEDLSTERPDWEEIKTFAAVVRGKTARSAAKSLGVHHSTISRRVEQLEASLNTRLFDRHPDGYVLTASGERLFAIATAFQDELTEVSREIAGTQDQLSGRLSITMPAPLATFTIGPRLLEFSTQYPEIEVELIASFGLLDISRMEADVAIRMDNNPPDGLVGRRLFRYCQAAYATTGYVSRHDIANHPENARLLGWRKNEETHPEWARGTGCEGVPTWGRFPDATMQLAAAKAGLGIALLPCLIADQDPDLVRVSAEPPIEDRDIWILTHRDICDTSRVRAFMDFAEEVLRALEPEMLGAGEPS